MTEKDNLKPNGLAGTEYTPDMFAQWGRGPHFVKMLTEMAGDESLPEQLRCAVVRYVAIQEQLSCMVNRYSTVRRQHQEVLTSILDDPSIDQLVIKYPLFRLII